VDPILPPKENETPSLIADTKPVLASLPDRHG
jgi:hypothetical protein